MTWEKRKAAVEIMSSCDCLSITDDDKKLIIAAFGEILRSLKEMGFATNIMVAQYAILKEATWDDGYFCIVTRQMCNDVYPVIKFCAKHFDNLITEA